MRSIIIEEKRFDELVELLIARLRESAADGGEIDGDDALTFRSANFHVYAFKSDVKNA